MGNTLETYVFSPKANEGEAAMFPRLFSGLLHPLIHLGHGPEFGLPGLAAEGKHTSNVMSHTTYILDFERTRSGSGDQEYLRGTVSTELLRAK
jgi:hypothetical protein